MFTTFPDSFMIFKFTGVFFSGGLPLNACTLTYTMRDTAPTKGTNETHSDTETKGKQLCNTDSYLLNLYHQKGIILTTKLYWYVSACHIICPIQFCVESNCIT